MTEDIHPLIDYRRFAKNTMPNLRNIYKLLDTEIRAKNIIALRYWLKGLQWQLARPKMPDPVFVVGCSRSGTTVTYETIRQSTSILAFGYELPRLWNGLWGPAHNGWDSEAATAEHARPAHRDAAFKFFYARLGQGRVLDKTCINVMRIPYLNKLFPNAHFIYIHRDGRDNISSLMEGWKLGEHFALEKFLGAFPCPVRIENGKFNQWCFFLPPGWRDYNEASLEEVCAYQWITANQMALDAKQLVPDKQWIQMRYEDLFYRPVEIFEDVFERLGLPFDEHIRNRCANLKAHPTSIVKGQPQLGKWKKQNPQAIERVIERISPLMNKLGYDVK